MARDFLAIPLSTVSSESAFSLGGRILGDHRSSLAPEMLEALVCGKDWLYKTKDPELCSDGEGMTSLHLFLYFPVVTTVQSCWLPTCFFCLINVYSFTVCRSWARVKVSPQWRRENVSNQQAWECLVQVLSKSKSIMWSSDVEGSTTWHCAESTTCFL